MRKDDVTAGLPGIPARRGRPPTRPQDEKSLKAAAAARQRAYRARQAAEGKEDLTLTLPADVAEALREYTKRRSADGAELTLGKAVEKFVRDRLMRKR